MTHGEEVAILIEKLIAAKLRDMVGNNYLSVADAKDDLATAIDKLSPKGTP